MVAELRRQGVEDGIELDEQQFALKMGSGQVLMLGNAYAE
jgi:hypothetical protein